MTEFEARTVEAIRSSWDCKTSSVAEDVHSLLEIIDTLAASKPPKGHIIDDTGTVRKVLGTLPLTADGCVIGPVEGTYARVWNNDQWSNNAELYIRDDGRWGAMFGPQWRPLECCYSTREAAEAARKEAI